MAQQHGGLTALLQQLERQVGDERKSRIVRAHQARERVFAHEGGGVLGLVELLGQVHVAQ